MSGKEILYGKLEEMGFNRYNIEKYKIIDAMLTIFADPNNAIDAYEVLEDRKRDVESRVAGLQQRSRELDYYKRVLKNTSESLQKERDELRRKEEELLKIRQEVLDAADDEYLYGATRAYHFILDQTGDKKTAAKAYDSYLLGRREET